MRASSYGRELRGDTAGAIEAMKLAIDAATATTEPTAWTTSSSASSTSTTAGWPTPSVSSASP